MDTNINENRVLTNVRLSQVQKLILTKLMLPNTTPLVSYDRISTGSNMVANRDILVKLGLIQLATDTANITTPGEEALRGEGLVDDSGTLTPTGEKYAYADNLNSLAKDIDQPVKPAEPNTDTKQPEREVSIDADVITQSSMEAPAPFESWTMISNMQETINHAKFIKDRTKK